MKRQAAAAKRLGSGPVRLLSKAELAGKLATDRYHGGSVLPCGSQLHPAKVMAEQALVAAAGASLYGGVAVQEDGAAGCRVLTVMSKVAANVVVVATNAYTGP